MPWAILCLWGIAVFFSYLGFGEALLRVLRIRKAPWAFAGALGIAAAAIAAGLLNILRLVHAPVLAVLVVVGDLLWVGLTAREWHGLRRHISSGWLLLRKRPGLALAWTLFFCALAIPVLGNVRGKAFAPVDDPRFYWTMPREVLQLGALPADPYSGRRISSTLGSPYVLQAEMLVVGDIRSLQFIDVSVGYILLLGILWSVCRARELQGWSLLAVLSLLILLPFDRINSTMIVLPAALFAAVALLSEIPEVSAGGRREMLLLAVLLAGICTMKTNLLPAAVLVGFFFYVLAFLLKKNRALVLRAVECGALVLLFLLPWMIDMKHKENTYLFPLLGRGYDITAYDQRWAMKMSTFLPYGRLWAEVVFLGAPLLLGIVTMWRAARIGIERHWIPLSALLLAAALALPVVTLSTGGESAGRYSFGFELPAVYLLFAALLSWVRATPARPWFFRGVLVLFVLWAGAIGTAFGIERHCYAILFRDAVAHPIAFEPLNIDAELARARAFQSSVPPGAPLYVRLKWSFPLDFRRNTVYNADMAGTAGPPPGPPLEQGPAALRQYFLDNGIRYFAFDYDRMSFGDRRIPAVSEFMQQSRLALHWWPRSEESAAGDTQRALEELGRAYVKLYDDGGIMVVDLMQPK